VRKTILFMLTTLDGFYEGPNADISWHNVDEEFNEFAIEQTQTAGALLFGRKTYEMMAAYWPTPEAVASDPVVAGWMNSLPKYVFSATLRSADWNNTTLVSGDAAAEVARLKEQPGKDLFVFGSSDLAASLLAGGQLDELRVMVNPLVLGTGKSLFAGVVGQHKLNLLRTRTFRSGNVLLFYAPAGDAA
jgi:dihydrofolate reductase